MTCLTTGTKWKKHEAKNSYGRENFIKDFSFIPEDTNLVEATKQIKAFIQPTSNESTQNKSQLSTVCYNIRSNKIPQSTSL